MRERDISVKKRDDRGWITKKIVSRYEVWYPKRKKRKEKKYNERK